MNQYTNSLPKYKVSQAAPGMHEPIPAVCLPRVSRCFHLTLVMATLLSCTVSSVAMADVTNRVVTSIKPVHSLVSTVMSGVGEPHLLMRGAASPHAFSMRPSDAVVLKDARIVFLIDKSMETSLANPVRTLASHARVVMLSEAQGLVYRRLREGGTFEAHSHATDQDYGHPEDEHSGEHTTVHGDDDHGHGEEDEHSGEHTTAHGDDDHGHGEEDEHSGEHTTAHGDDDHGHGEEDEHSGEHTTVHGDDVHGAGEFGAYNMHVWLDPENAAAMARMIASVLSEVDPANASVYAANTETLLQRLEHLTLQIAADLSPVRGKPFIVLHDAYRYFEDRFGLNAAGSVMVGSEQSPSVRRIKSLRNKVHELGAICVFAEPQFDSRLVEVLIEGTPARAGILDPLGAAIASGPEAYFILLHNLAASFKSCLGPADQ